jgi:hypothetical protein
MGAAGSVAASSNSSTLVDMSQPDEEIVRKLLPMFKENPEKVRCK